MEKRILGKTGVEASLLGFGAMRLPMIPGSGVDRPRGIRMIRRGVDEGISYIDTAYTYLASESEIVVGQALKDGYRDRVTLTTKLPPWLVESKEHAMAMVDDMLKKLDVDHLDFLLLHALDVKNIVTMEQYELLDVLEKAKSAGKIRFAGFSFHAGYETFESLLGLYGWDLAQIQLNILDENYQAGVRGLHLAHEKNIPVVIMEPLKGGLLGRPQPEAVRAIIGNERSMPSWAFHYLANLPVSVILSGFSCEEHLEETLNIFNNDDMSQGHLSEAELDVINQVRAFYNRSLQVQCTGCRYCMPCPQQVDIPFIFEHFNDVSLSGNVRKGFSAYQRLSEMNQGVDQCVECGVCEDACPQHLPIREKLRYAHQSLMDMG
ncbi:MAG: aldo/keto reductase [Christensenellales bacterium]|jgi:predicted aldo/keto reductase-like oxidoreductase